MCVCVYFMLMLWFVPVFVICLCLHHYNNNSIEQKNSMHVGHEDECG